MCLFRRNNQVQKRGKVSFVGKLHLATEKTNREDEESIIALRILRLQVRESKATRIIYLRRCRATFMSNILGCSFGLCMPVLEFYL